MREFQEGRDIIPSTEKSDGVFRVRRADHHLDTLSLFAITNEEKFDMRKFRPK